MDVTAADGATKGTVELPEKIFKHTGTDSLLWEAVRVYLANQRQGTAKTKTRAEVSGTGKKPYRQKHTGNARHGSRRSPIFRTGGIVFGPLPRDYSLNMPKQKRRSALYAALSARHAEGAVRVVEDFELSEAKTKQMVQAISGFGFEGTVLLMPAEVPEAMRRAGRNIPWLTLMPARMVNTYAVLDHDIVAFTRAGLASFAEATGAA
ncbi:MAG: 50S ribosomal protein L4 [bacterium]